MKRSHLFSVVEPLGWIALCTIGTVTVSNPLARGCFLAGLVVFTASLAIRLHRVQIEAAAPSGH